MRQCSMLAVSELLSIFGVVAFLARRQFSAVGLGILCFSSFHFVYAEPLLAEKAEKNKLESKERPGSTSKFLFFVRIFGGSQGVVREPGC